MTTHHTIHIVKTNTDLKVTYRDNKFKKLEHLRGKLNQEMLNNICRIVPLHETDIPTYQDKYQDKITYQKIEKEKTLYSQFVAEWYAFYRQYVGVEPKFTGADGNALKQIIIYLKLINTTEQEALAMWQLILSKWIFLDAFHRKQTDLKYINSKLNIIINNVKDSNQSNEQVFTNATQSEVGKNFKFK